MLAGTAVIWINGRWPELSGQGRNRPLQVPERQGTESQEDSGEQESAGRSSRESHGPLEPESESSGAERTGQYGRIRCTRCFLSAYDGRTTGRAPSIKNQGSLGTCWAFASLMALEARLLPDENYDFSEDHMSLNNGFCIPQSDGGSTPCLWPISLS